MQAAVSIQNLSKRYRLGSASANGYRTLRESLMRVGAAPWRQMQRMRRPSSTASPARDADDLWALDDVSFDVEPGDAIGIIGRNGAGKSTLLKIITQITEPTRGRVTYSGRLGSLLEVGTGFHQELTGRENIFLNGAILGMTRRQIARSFDAIVEFSEVERFLDTPVKRYSSGMYVRLAFAVAAHLEPDILIVDEVLAVGDAVFQKKCLGRMSEIGRSGRTVLFVSHNMATVLNLCKKAVVLDCGRLVFAGPVSEGVQMCVKAGSDSCGCNIDLRTHAKRRPGSTPILGHVRLLDAAGRPINQVLCGAPVRIEVHTVRNNLTTEPHVAIGIDDHLGCRVFTAATYLTDSAPATVRRDRKLLCSVDELPLAPGRYALTLNAGPQGAQWTDVVDQALWFDVVASDFYGNGKTPNPDWGRALIRSHWAPVDTAFET